MISEIPALFGIRSKPYFAVSPTPILHATWLANYRVILTPYSADIIQQTPSFWMANVRMWNRVSSSKAFFSSFTKLQTTKYYFLSTLFSSVKNILFFFYLLHYSSLYLLINSTDHPLLWRWKSLTEVEVDWEKVDTTKKVNYHSSSCYMLNITYWLMAFNCVKVTERCIPALNRTT